MARSARAVSRLPRVRAAALRTYNHGVARVTQRTLALSTRAPTLNAREKRERATRKPRRRRVVDSTRSLRNALQTLRYGAVKSNLRLNTGS
eukprot:920214-Lingulodinium_polyedra.AAC.1